MVETLPVTFSALDPASSGQVAQLAALTTAPERWRSMIDHGLREGTTRTQWLWRADDGDQLLAAALWWSSGSGEGPAMVDLLGDLDASAIAELLTRSRVMIGARSALCSLQVDGQIGDLAEARPVLASALRTAGFAPEVERVRVQWTPNSPLPPAPRELTMRAAATIHETDLIELFAAVGDGSLDHGMITGREGMGRRDEAERRLRSANRYDGEPHWFTVGTDRAGALVGYVVPALVNGDRPVIAELGVAAAHRGERYSDALLAHATRLLARSGAPQIRADTDLANAPMRAAFIRAGYVEFARRFDYTWQAVPSHQ